MKFIYLLAICLLLTKLSYSVPTNDTLKRVFVSGKFYKIKHGRVTPLPNSTVCIKGTRVNSITDSEGCYLLDVTVLCDTARTLVVSGYLEDHEAQEFEVQGPFAANTKVNFELQPKDKPVVVSRGRH